PDDGIARDPRPGHVVPGGTRRRDGGEGGGPHPVPAGRCRAGWRVPPPVVARIARWCRGGHLGRHRRRMSAPPDGDHAVAVDDPSSIPTAGGPNRGPAVGRVYAFAVVVATMAAVVTATFLVGAHSLGDLAIPWWALIPLFAL